MDFVKKNLLSIIALAIGLIALIVGWIVSSGMTASQIEEVRQDAMRAAGEVNSQQVDYTFSALRPGEEPWSMERVTPNSRMTEIIGERRTALAAQSEQIREAAIEHNRRGKSVLVEGLFPAPEDEQSERISLSAQMVEAWPEAHRTLLGEVDAGGPIDPAQMSARLATQREQIVERILGARANQQLSEEEQREINGELTSMRLGLLKSHADGLAVFADTSAFPKLSDIPGDGLVTADRYQTLFWDWQHAFWVHSDIMHAVREANAGSPGVSAAPVKRIFTITLGPAYNQPVTTGDLSQPIPEDYSRSFTGRVGGNPLYDIRYATIDAIIDLSRLAEIENAFAATNFMTLIDLDYTQINPDLDLGAGYYYGDQSLVRAQMQIETVWLRSWIEPYLPPRVREAMGLSELTTDTPNDDTEDQF